MPYLIPPALQILTEMTVDSKHIDQKGRKMEYSAGLFKKKRKEKKKKRKPTCQHIKFFKINSFLLLFLVFHSANILL